MHSRAGGRHLKVWKGMAGLIDQIAAGFVFFARIGFFAREGFFRPKTPKADFSIQAKIKG